MRPLFWLPVVFSIAQIHAAEPTVTLAGVQVVFDDGAEDFDGFKTFNLSAKTRSVALIVRSKGKAMVGFDEEKATLTLGGAKAECRFFSNMAFSEDRLAMKLEFDTTETVEMDAQGRFKVAGGLPVVLASGKEETRSTPFEVKTGTAILFAEGGEDMPKLKIKSVGKPDFGDAEFEIEFSTNRQLDGFAGIRFYTKDGKPVEAEQSGSSWMGLGNRGSGEVSFQFKAKHSELILAVESWTGREEILLKVDLSAGLAPPKP